MARAGIRIGVASVVVAAALLFGITQTADAFLLLVVAVLFGSAVSAMVRERQSRHRVREWVDAIRAERAAAIRSHHDPGPPPT
jgi:hypothetical protein